MGMKSPKDGAPGTTDQSPRWEGPEENKPRGYMPAKDTPQSDSKGQFAKSQADRKADGVVSAKPTVITGSEDATVHRDPPRK